MACSCKKTPQEREEERRKLAEQRKINRERQLQARAERLAKK